MPTAAVRSAALTARHQHRMTTDYKDPIQLAKLKADRRAAGPIATRSTRTRREKMIADLESRRARKQRRADRKTSA